MSALRGFLIGFANVIIVVVIVVAMIGGFIGGGSASFGGFSFIGAIVGAIVGFLTSCAAMSALAVLLDIRELLKQIELRGGRI